MTAQFDMFSDDVSTSRKSAGGAGARQAFPGAMDEDSIVAHLAKTGRYRILRKLQHRQVAGSAKPGFPMRGVILDTETTGLQHRTNEIIEIGVIAFSFDNNGQIGDVLGVYGGLQQPSLPVPADITRLTGITDDIVAGKSIDLQALKAIVEPADLIIAHNAGFDRPFCDAFSTMFSGKAWACSNAEIDWSARGYEGTKLAYLIGQAGYFHDGHRAVDDCFALLEVLDHRRDDAATTAFAELLTASRRSRVRIYAENSPFDLKDHLKARGYRWSDGSDGRPKSWWVEVDETEKDNEIAYLRAEIYGYPDADPPTVSLTAFDRFRA